MNIAALKTRLPGYGWLRKWKARHWDARLFRLELGWELASGYHASIRNRAEWNVYNDLFVDGEYDAAIDATLAAARDEPVATIVDLGANVGFFTLRFLDRWQRLGSRPALRFILVEGSEPIFLELETRVERWLRPGVEIKVHHGLAGERGGVASFVQTESHLGSHVGAAGAMVPYLDLDALVPSGRIALLKCDIEGSENALLTSFPALLARTDRAVFEFHHWVRDPQETLRAVLAHGFVEPRCLRQMPDYSTYAFSRSSAAS